METLAYLHLVMAREIPGDAKIGTSQRRTLCDRPIAWRQVSSQIAFFLLSFSCGLMLLGPIANAAIQQGDRGDKVTQLQKALAEAGYYRGSLTGFYGKLTEAAVAQFQQDKGLTADGIAGTETLAALQDGSTPDSTADRDRDPNFKASSPDSAALPLSKGDRGTEVTRLQQQLHAAGYYDGPVTGFYGELTQAAVSRFQQEKALVADGVVGSKTLARLQEAANQPDKTTAQQQNTNETSPDPATDRPENQSAEMPLSLAATGANVKQLQRSLRLAGYDPGKIDGIYGSKTKAAVAKFQQDRELTVDGIADAKILAALRSESKQSESKQSESQPSESQPSESQQSAKKESSKRGNSARDPDAEPKATASTTATVLSLGDKGAVVAELQKELQAAGYYTADIDGVYGSATEDAVKGIQVAANLKVDGVVDEKTRAALQKSAAVTASPERSYLSEDNILRRGSRGATVTDLQEKLRATRHYRGAIDGIYGSETEQAIRSFQRSQNLDEDGLAGPKTLSALTTLSQ